MTATGSGNLAKVREATTLGFTEQRILNTCLIAGNWFALCAEPRQEALAVGEIAKGGFVAYWPRAPRQERHGRGAIRSVYRSVFPGYLFVKCVLTSEAFQYVKNSRGVKRFLGAEKPIPVSDDAIAVIKLYESEKAEEERCRVAKEEARLHAQQNGRSGIIWDFTAGEQVLIKNGPFSRFYAELTAAVDEHDRIRALVNAFGRASTIEISAFDIEKV